MDPPHTAKAFPNCGQESHTRVHVLALIFKITVLTPNITHGSAYQITNGKGISPLLAQPLTINYLFAQKSGQSQGRRIRVGFGLGFGSRTAVDALPPDSPPR